MEPLFIEIGPEEPVSLTSHEGEEFLVAVSGQLVIHYGRERHLLEPGDSVYYNSIVPHSVSAGGGATATAYAVIYQPF
jgi:mannose-6-phosphate isomerase-like protein (cupin superfamily)